MASKLYEAVISGIVEAAEDRQQPVLDWLAWWKLTRSVDGVILAGLRLEAVEHELAEDAVLITVNGEVTVQLDYTQVDDLRNRLHATLR